MNRGTNARPLDESPPRAALDESYPAIAEYVASARWCAARWLRERQIPEPLCDDVLLAVSEVCTNVVLHAYRGMAAGTFRMLLELDGTTLRVTVSDDGLGLAPNPDSPGAGYGLALVATLADSCEIRSSREPPGTSVTMWFPLFG